MFIVIVFQTFCKNYFRFIAQIQCERNKDNIIMICLFLLVDVVVVVSILTCRIILKKNEVLCFPQ